MAAVTGRLSAPTALVPSASTAARLSTCGAQLACITHSFPCGHAPPQHTQHGQSCGAPDQLPATQTSAQGPYSWPPSPGVHAQGPPRKRAQHYQASDTCHCQTRHACDLCVANQQDSKSMLYEHGRGCKPVELLPQHHRHGVNSSATPQLLVHHTALQPLRQGCTDASDLRQLPDCAVRSPSTHQGGQQQRQAGQQSCF